MSFATSRRDLFGRSAGIFVEQLLRGFILARMKSLVVLAVLSLSIAAVMPARAEPLRLHPENPHYFLWRGKPAVLVTSAEHYGAVINLDFDFAKYLKTLESERMNHTRIWAGAYVEPTGAFNIASNTLAPSPGKFICPWARSDQPGYTGGGNKFDLTKWDEKYFKRLHDFMKEANKRGVVVEMNLFCPMYEESMWKLSPQNAINNVNGAGDISRTNVHTLDKNGALLAIQEAMTRKIVMELNEFDNIFYEICNEPYFGGVTMEWQHHIADIIAKTERTLPKKHLISLNIANGNQKIVDPHPAISIFNFHYASPPKTVGENYGLNKVIGLNETGFKGTNNTDYRMEAWAFMLAGGALYNNLDYSFVAGHERGDFVYPAKQPGGGNPDLRRQFAIMREFIESFEFVRMKPDTKWVKSGVPPKTHLHALAENGQQYGAYFFSNTNAVAAQLSLNVSLPAGDYRVEWVDVLTGKKAKSERVKSTGEVTITSPEYKGEVALRIRR